jgi:hypothetical protein
MAFLLRGVGAFSVGALRTSWKTPGRAGYTNDGRFEGCGENLPAGIIGFFGFVWPKRGE